MYGGGLTEWFVNDSRGLEQGWTLEKRIGSEDSEEPMRLQFGIRGQLSPRVAAGGLQVSFQDESGATVFYQDIYDRDPKLRARRRQGRSLSK